MQFIVHRRQPRRDFAPHIVRRWLTRGACLSDLVRDGCELTTFAAPGHTDVINSQPRRSDSRVYQGLHDGAHISSCEKLSSGLAGRTLRPRAEEQGRHPGRRPTFVRLDGITNNWKTERGAGGTLCVATVCTGPETPTTSRSSRGGWCTLGSTRHGSRIRRTDTRRTSRGGIADSPVSRCMRTETPKPSRARRTSTDSVDTR